MIIKDLFTYFAQFVPKDALRDMFYQEGADGSAYASLKEEVLALPDTRVQGELTDFIFGPDEDSARERINHTRGVFLFVDYSAATSYIDRLDVKTDKMHIGVTVAVHTPDDTDQPGLALLQDHLPERVHPLLLLPGGRLLEVPHHPGLPCRHPRIHARRRPRAHQRHPRPLLHEKTIEPDDED